MFQTTRRKALLAFAFASQLALGVAATGCDRVYEEIVKEIERGHGGDGGTTNACAAALCPAGTVCVEKQVQCVKAPCPPVAECVPPVKGPPPPIPTSCAAVTCAEGSHCEVQEVVCVRAPCPPVAQCVENKK